MYVPMAIPEPTRPVTIPPGAIPGQAITATTNRFQTVIRTTIAGVQPQAAQQNRGIPFLRLVRREATKAGAVPLLQRAIARAAVQALLPEVQAAIQVVAVATHPVHRHVLVRVTRAAATAVLEAHTPVAAVVAAREAVTRVAAREAAQVHQETAVNIVNA